MAFDMMVMHGGSYIMLNGVTMGMFRLDHKQI
jgi:hypothetical protein